jgi:hypothetical protein
LAITPLSPLWSIERRLQSCARSAGRAQSANEAGLENLVLGYIQLGERRKKGRPNNIIVAASAVQRDSELSP